VENDRIFYITTMQISFLRKIFIASKYNLNTAQNDKLNALNSFLNFADSNRIIEKDFHFDRETCYDR